MPHYSEYQAPTVGQSTCSYSSLRKTYSGQQALENVPSMAIQTVPNYCPNNVNGPSYPPRYDTLSHGNQMSCGGHFNMSAAYPFANCTSCNAGMTQRNCAGGNICTPAMPNDPLSEEGFTDRLPHRL